jgi:hypothetical protein
MNRRIVNTIATCSFALVIVVGATWQIRAQDPKTPYPTMAPIGEYLMDRSAEIALARSAAPKDISDDAEVKVLGRHGYESAVKGKNGFVCVVERAWMGPFDGTGFWNPKIRGPLCFNPPAARSILPITYKRTELVLAGQSKQQVSDAIKAAIDKKELPPLEPGAMSYMMSKQAYLTDSGDHNLAHLMIYTPLMDGAAWGAGLPNSPVILNPQFRGPERIDVFLVPVGLWSDGTAAPVM